MMERMQQALKDGPCVQESSTRLQRPLPSDCDSVQVNPTSLWSKDELNNFSSRLILFLELKDNLFLVLCSCEGDILLAT